MLIDALPEGDDDRLLNEVYGWFNRCFAASAQHETDYLINLGQARLYGRSRTAELIRIAKRVGLIVGEVDLDGFPHLQLLDDPKFHHMRTKAERAHDNSRTKVANNHRLRASILLRDGAACRWCGVITTACTADHKSGRAGEFDHLHPADVAAGRMELDRMVLSCLSCNRSRGNADPDSPRFPYPLQPAPADPFYTAPVATYINEHLTGHKGTPVRPAPDLRPDHSGDAVPAGPGGLRTGSPADAARALADQVSVDEPIDRDRATSTEPVIPRDGAGRVGPGEAGTEREAPRRRRKRRSRRKQSNEPPTKGDPRV